MDVNNKKFPWDIKDVEGEEKAELMKYFKGVYSGFVRVGPKGYIYPQKYKHVAANIYNMEIRSTDIFVNGYPRSGSTVTQELVWMIQNNLDFAGSQNCSSFERIPILELSIIFHPIMMNQLREENKDSEENSKELEKYFPLTPEQIGEIPSPRFIKSHLPFSLLPPSLLDIAKVVYVARDPRDVAVSFYHLNKLHRGLGYDGDFKKFWEFFMNDNVTFSPYFEHLKEAWQRKHHPNMLFLFYEDMQKNMLECIQRVTDFFGKKYTNDELKTLVEYLNITNFKKNPAVNRENVKRFYNKNEESCFIRKGQAGGWRDYFDAEMTLQAERWIADNLQDTDLRFPNFDF